MDPIWSYGFEGFFHFFLGPFVSQPERPERRTWGKEGMPIELIAKVLEISVAAVKWSLERVDGVAAQVRIFSLKTRVGVDLLKRP